MAKDRTQSPAASGSGSGQWVACHDTLVCTGAKPIQRWCVRVGDKRGPLIAVMLSKDAAHLLAAAPDLLAAAQSTLTGLNGRMKLAAAAGVPIPVFYGIADLHAAIARATGAAP